MKQKSTSQSAFFNLRVLIGLSVVLIGAFLALIGLGTFSGLTASSAQAQQNHKIIYLQDLSPGFDCAAIHASGIDRQENFRAGAIMIACGEAQGGSASSYGAFSRQLLDGLTAPLAFGATDVDEVTGADSISHPTQSETYTLANPDNPNQIVVTYNDSRTASANYSGASFSSDGGTTFTRLNPSPFASGHGTNFGDPVTLYNKPTNTFFAIFIATSCGGQGFGAWKSTDGGATWAVGPCVANAGSGAGDRESGWSDNNPSSPFFGRMYMSYNDFGVGVGALRVTFSTDNGATWHAPINVSNTSTFIRDVQITGDLSGNGTIYIAGMDESGGGFPHNDINHIYRSTDGGNTWVHTYNGPSFAGPGVTSSGYFACMFNPPAYWRHEGWGEPAAFNNVVHLVYAQHGAGADAGDVYYIRSTDSGATFGAPFKLNSDATTRPQWQPNISVSPSGTLFATWYDGREFASCTYGNPAVPCYRMWSRKSTDNGVTWLADNSLSDVASPLPAQPDVTVQSTYAGDYDYGTAIATEHLTSWDDGRVTISGQSQQDTFFDKEAIGATGIPCGDLVSFQVRCVTGTGGDKLQAKLTLTNTSHSGQQVTITVDSTPHSVTINGNKATLQMHGTAGTHTVQLTNPAGCFPPSMPSCP